MARRARKGVETSQIIIIAVVVLALGGVAALLASRSKDVFAGLNDLPVIEFRDSGNSLSGNVYKLTGTVFKKERFTENGQMIVVEVASPTGAIDVMVYVPVELYGTNIDRGDAIVAKVEVLPKGVLKAQEIQ